MMIYEKSDFEKTINLIQSFLELYPDEEWGFAHIVLSDFNLEDHALQPILDQAQSELEVNHPTRLFLELLYAIPEEKRARPE